mmetsp:Transcript_8329/g.22916  ORF Transcript_8329/g.22916 Transcript_8329/m.22916 type:complete len:493 (-) Transcript_8329:134-1612(-)
MNVMIKIVTSISSWRWSCATNSCTWAMEGSGKAASGRAPRSSGCTLSEKRSYLCGRKVASLPVALSARCECRAMAIPRMTASVSGFCQMSTGGILASMAMLMWRPSRREMGCGTLPCPRGGDLCSPEGTVSAGAKGSEERLSGQSGWALARPAEGGVSSAPFASGGVGPMRAASSPAAARLDSSLALAATGTSAWVGGSASRACDCGAVAECAAAAAARPAAGQHAGDARWLAWSSDSSAAPAQPGSWRSSLTSPEVHATDELSISCADLRPCTTCTCASPSPADAVRDWASARDVWLRGAGRAAPWGRATKASMSGVPGVALATCPAAFADGWRSGGSHRCTAGSVAVAAGPPWNTTPAGEGTGVAGMRLLARESSPQWPPKGRSAKCSPSSKPPPLRRLASCAPTGSSFHTAATPAMSTVPIWSPVLSAGAAAGSRVDKCAMSSVTGKSQSSRTDALPDGHGVSSREVPASRCVKWGLFVAATLKRTLAP